MVEDIITAKEVFNMWKQTDGFLGISIKDTKGNEIIGYDEYRDLPVLSLAIKGRELIVIVNK